MRRFRRFLAVGLGVLAVVAPGAAPALAAGPVNHAISFTKGCESPVSVGQPYVCTYSIRNNVDEAQDTLTFTGLTDTVASASGPVASGNVMTSLEFEIATGSPSCNGIGTGTSANPFRNATVCTLPFGSRLDVQPFSFYTAQAGDFNLPGHTLTDAAELTWHDLCDDPAHTSNTNCVPNPPNVGGGSQSIVTQIPSTTATAIHNAAHAVVTAVTAGSTVHDFVAVSGGAGNPIPTGSVTIEWFTNNLCAGSPAATTASPIPLGPAGTADATSFLFGPLGAGLFGFRAHYLGDPANPVYAPSDGPCEPLRVVDANIQISPNATRPVGTPQTLTAHVNVNDGSGSADALPGTHVTFSLDSGPGTPNPPTACDTVGTTGSCTTTITSSTTGDTFVSAHTIMTVGGVVLAPSTNGTGGSSGPATTTWVAAARISIAPDGTSEVGQPHTFTVAVEQDSGSGFVGIPNQHVDFTLTGTFGAAAAIDTATSTCDDAGPNTDAQGRCTIVFTSATPGKVTGTASATVTIAGSPVTLSTNGVAPNSGPAVNTFVDAKVEIGPPLATNPVGANHTLTGHAMVNLGDGAGYVNAPAGTQIRFAAASGPGSIAGSPCSTVGATGACTATLSSAVAGTTIVNASTTLTTATTPSVILTRTTNGTAGNSGPATKGWADDLVTTKVRDASNADVTGSTTVPPGTVVHDEATVTKAAGTPASAPNPTGTVSFALYANAGCSGTAMATDPNRPLSAGVASSATFTVPAVVGSFSYLAQYNGDANYPAHAAACESFTVQSASGQLATLLTQVTGVGSGTSLAAKVTQIQGYVAANDKAHACSTLNAFINEVSAQTGKKVTAAQAASFIAQAQTIAATLGC